jgi:A/G-specific adenine glycosylase
MPGADPGVLRLLEEAERRRDRFQRAVLDWASKNLRDFPWRRDRTPYRVLVAEVILRRTTSTAALRVYEEFLRRWPDIRALSEADEGELEALLESVGYHRRRARILVDIAKFIVGQYGGAIPCERGALLRIPHVGPYIAGAILSLGYGVPSTMVDSNVERVLSRVFSRHLPARGRSRAIHEVARVLVPSEGHAVFNLGLLDLGALVCRYGRPNCGICPLYTVCDMGGYDTGE